MSCRGGDDVQNAGEKRRARRQDRISARTDSDHGEGGGDLDHNRNADITSRHHHSASSSSRSSSSSPPSINSAIFDSPAPAMATAPLLALAVQYPAHADHGRNSEGSDQHPSASVSASSSAALLDNSLLAAIGRNGLLFPPSSSASSLPSARSEQRLEPPGLFDRIFDTSSDSSAGAPSSSQPTPRPISASNLPPYASASASQANAAATGGDHAHSYASSNMTADLGSINAQHSQWLGMLDQRGRPSSDCFAVMQQNDRPMMRTGGAGSGAYANVQQPEAGTMNGALFMGSNSSNARDYRVSADRKISPVSLRNQGTNRNDDSNKYGSDRAAARPDEPDGRNDSMAVATQPPSRQIASRHPPSVIYHQSGMAATYSAAANPGPHGEFVIGHTSRGVPSLGLDIAIGATTAPTGPSASILSPAAASLPMTKGAAAGPSENRHDDYAANKVDEPQRNQQSSSKSNSSSGSKPASTRVVSHAEKWQLRYRDLVAFKQKHGHCLVPLENSDNPQLAHWVKRQRCQWKNISKGKKSTLTPERLELLKRLDFVWDAHQAAWQFRLIQFRQFVRIHGHGNVPSRYPPNPSLAVWAKFQRGQYRAFEEGSRSNLTQERVDDLSALGFVWDIHADYQEHHRIDNNHSNPAQQQQAAAAQSRIQAGNYGSGGDTSRNTMGNSNNDGDRDRDAGQSADDGEKKRAAADDRKHK